MSHAMRFLNLSGISPTPGWITARAEEVLIRGDKSAMHGMMMQVFDACRLHKLTRISLGALPLVQGQ
jgi:hypothetical protein